VPSGSAITSPSTGLSPGGGALSRIQNEREQLTVTLRGLAADLDELDRQLSEWVWPRRPLTVAEPPIDRAALEARRAQLNTRLRGLARQLNDLDRALSALKGYDEWTPDRVGVCPHCGYPSLGSGLCAFCRPFLAG
jgi:hypothetical protein